MFSPDRNVRRIAMIGNHTPRKCGIATFTKDTASALRRAGFVVDVVAMSDHPGHDYPDGVLFDIPQDDFTAYLDAANRINMGCYDVVLVQHEYGIFGGPAGAHILALLRDLKVPIITTLHTVLKDPNPDQLAVLEELAGLSARFVVMSDKARELLMSVNGIPSSQIEIIPHGIPDLPDEDPEELKRSLGIEGKKVVLTFGLLSPDKGIEYGINAMAEVPDATYVILGQTHPHIKRDHGEGYREGLQALAASLGIADRVIFLNRFVDDAELTRYLNMADVYVTPYLKPEQVTSGTLAYTVGNGKAVVSTPYWHAQELLAEGRGVLVPFRDAGKLAFAINGLLLDSQWKSEIEQRAFAYGRQMTWPRVAEGLARCFEVVSGETRSMLENLINFAAVEKSKLVLPPVRLDHIRALTDDTGIIQHATYTIPNRDEGYCIDDNARALLLMVRLESAGMDDAQIYRLQNIYLSFCAYALDKSKGRFRNFLPYDRRWVEKQGSEDSHGRTLWALGETAAVAKSWGMRQLARQLFEEAEGVVESFTSPRAWAYSLLGCVRLGRTRLANEFTTRLVNLYRANASQNWCWFEEKATYCNARLSQSLILAGRALHRAEAVEIGLKTLNWLCEVQTRDGRYCPIGNDGFLEKGGKRALFDQQPVEAAAHVAACLTAFEATCDAKWQREAERAFGWFMGQNLLGAPLADRRTGGCRDGLLASGPNENQGAESTISYLGAIADLQLASAHLSMQERLAAFEDGLEGPLTEAAS